MHAIKIRKIGNSLGATIPRDILAQLNIGEGDTLYLTQTESGIHLTPYDPDFVDAMSAFETTRKTYRNALRKLAE